MVHDCKRVLQAAKADDCPPWSIKAEKVTHDRTKKQLLYENAVLNIYDIPILYFPIFSSRPYSRTPIWFVET